MFFGLSVALSFGIIVLACLAGMHTPPATTSQQVAAAPPDTDPVFSDYDAATLLAKTAIAKASYWAIILQAAGSKGPHSDEVVIEWKAGGFNTGIIYRGAQARLSNAFAALPVHAVLEPMGVTGINGRFKLTASLTVSLIENPP